MRKEWEIEVLVYLIYLIFNKIENQNRNIVFMLFVLFYQRVDVNFLLMLFVDDKIMQVFKCIFKCIVF